MNSTDYRQPDVDPVGSALVAASVAEIGAPAEIEVAVGAIVNDCVIAFGQGIGMRKTVEADAMNFLIDHFRGKFLAALQAFGNRWEQDRDNVTGVAMLLSERAVRHAADRESVDLESVRKAAADVERHCTLHARRAARAAGPATEGAQARIAGFWCTDDKKP